MIKGTLVLNTDICQIYHTGPEYRVLIRMASGEWLEHNPFPGDLKGLVNALDLSMNVVSGKFWVKDVFKFENKSLGSNRLLNGGKHVEKR